MFSVGVSVGIWLAVGVAGFVMGIEMVHRTRRTRPPRHTVQGLRTVPEAQGAPPRAPRTASMDAVA